MNILIASLCIIIILPLAVLLAPVSFHVKARLAEKAACEGELAWAGGLLAAKFVFKDNIPSFFLHFGIWGKHLERGRNPSKRKRTSQKKSTKHLRVRYIKPFINTRFLKEVFRFLNRFQRSLNLRLSLEGEYGTNDPAFTGFIAGLIAALNSNRCCLCLYPNFSETTLNLQGEIRGRLIPARLICLIFRTLFAAPVRKIWWFTLKQNLNHTGG